MPFFNANVSSEQKMSEKILHMNSEDLCLLIVCVLIQD